VFVKGKKDRNAAQNAKCDARPPSHRGRRAVELRGAERAPTRRGGARRLFADVAGFEQKRGYVTYADHAGVKWKRAYAVIQARRRPPPPSCQHLVPLCVVARRRGGAAPPPTPPPLSY
jgi:hypothetical protein